MLVLSLSNCAESVSRTHIACSSDRCLDHLGYLSLQTNIILEHLTIDKFPVEYHPYVMSVALERTDNNPPLLPEKEQEVSFVPVSELDLDVLAARTNGKPINEKVFWSTEDGTFSGRLSKETRRTYDSNKVTDYYFQTETFKDRINDYVVAYMDGVTALIEPVNPISGIIAGFEIKNGLADRIMGNESKFPKAYAEARNLAYEAKVEIH